MKEIVEKRTLRTKTFDLGGGKYTLRTGIKKPLHYVDARGELCDIDVCPCEDRGQFLIDKAPYTARIGRDRPAYRYTGASGTVSAELVEIAGEPVKMAEPEVADNRFYWRGLAADFDCTIVPRNARLDALVTLHSDDAPRAFAWEILGNKSMLRPVIGRDAKGRPLEIEQAWDGDRLRIRWTGKVIDKSGARQGKPIDQPKYPVWIDPTVNEAVVAGGDDAHSIYKYGSFNASGTEITVAFSNYLSTIFGGWRFQSVAVPQGVTVDSATLTLDVLDVRNDAASVDFYGNDTDDAAVWSTGNRMGAITKTTAKANQSFSTAFTGTVGVDVTSIVQEILDRTGWASSNDMAIIGKGLDLAGSFNTVQFAAYEHASRQEAQLDITYTVPVTVDDLTGDDLTTAAPVLDQGSLTQTHALTGNSITASAPVLDEGALSQTDVLAGDDLAAAAPVLDQGDLGQNHSLAGDDLTAAAPVLDQGALSQLHALTGDDVAAAAPVLDAGDLGQTHSLAGDDLAAAAPVLDDGALSQLHALTGDDLTAAAAALDEGVLTQLHALIGDDLTAAAPVLDEGALTQNHALTGDAIAATAPVLNQGALSQLHALTGNEITAAAPVLDEGDLGQTQALVGDDLAASAPALDQGNLGQTHALSGDGLTAPEPVLDTPTLSTSGIDALAGDDLDASAPVLDTGDLSTTVGLTGETLGAAAPVLEAGALTQTHALAGDDLTAAAALLDEGVLSQTHGLSGSALTAAAPELDSGNLGQTHSLAGNDITAAAPVLDSPALKQLHALSGGKLTAGAPILAEGVLGQVHALTGDDLTAAAPEIGQGTLGDGLPELIPPGLNATFGRVGVSATFGRVGVSARLSSTTEES